MAITLALSLAASQVHAQSPTGAAAPTTLVITAARTPLALADTLSQVTVVTRAEIERQGFGDIADLLRNLGGVELTRTGGPGQPTSLYIRGAETRHTMVMIDGVRIDSQSTGGAPWESIPLAQVDRIEIVKGPASAIYGSDAIGGVVQIFTRRGGERTALELGGAWGSLATGRGDASLSGRFGIFDYAIAAAAERSAGFQLVTDPANYNYLPDRAPWRKHSETARLGAQLDAADRIEWIAIRSHLDAQYNDYGALNHGIEDTNTQKLDWVRQWSGALSTRIGFGQADARYEATPDAYLTDTRIRSVSFEGSWQLTEGQRLLFVAERRADRLVNTDLSQTATPGVGDRHEDGAALGYVWHHGGTDIQAHARRDRDSQFGSVDTGSLAAGQELGGGFKLVGSLGNAFRAPTLYQIGSVYGPDTRIAGVRALVPERGREFELGLKYAGAMADVSITGYRNRLSNLINFGAAGSCLSPYGCYVNVQSARLQGLSLNAALRWAGWQFSGSFDLQDPKDLGTGKRLARRAREFGTLQARTQLAAWEFGAGVQASGRRYDDAANRVPLGGYALLNLDAALRLTNDLKLQFNLDNAFDRQYQTANGYAQSPRTLMVGLRYTPTF
ncbi:MAG: TonB-dependent receptor [Burkholderiales bacterium]|nr:TonB-dependent receptor [Burkholderiales bacterium]